MERDPWPTSVKAKLTLASYACNRLSDTSQDDIDKIADMMDEEPHKSNDDHNSMSSDIKVIGGKRTAILLSASSITPEGAAREYIQQYMKSNGGLII